MEAACVGVTLENEEAARLTHDGCCQLAAGAAGDGAGWGIVQLAYGVGCIRNEQEGGGLANSAGERPTGSAPQASTQSIPCIQPCQFLTETTLIHISATHNK